MSSPTVDQLLNDESEMIRKEAEKALKKFK
jgi:hypothetical protein